MPTVTLANSQYPVFADAEKADYHLAGDVSRAASWATRNAEAKARGLISATRLLLTLPWCDTPPDPSAAAADIPDVVQEVTAELAADLLAKPRLFADASGSSNVKSAKAGSAQVEFFAPVEGGPPLPRALWDRLSVAGLVCLVTDGGTVLEGPFPTGTYDGVRPLEGRYPNEWYLAAMDYD